MKTIETTFVMDNDPARRAWPKHGYIFHDPKSICLCRDDHHSTPALFSQEQALQGLELSIRAGFRTRKPDVIRNQIRQSSLPKAKTRWDRFSSGFSLRIPEFAQLFERLCGVALPEEGSGPARMEVCMSVGACGNDCRGYPRHGRLFYKGTLHQSATVYSTTGARRRVGVCADFGLFGDEEAESILEQIARVDFPDDEAARQADRFNYGATHDELAAFLPIVFGIRKSNKRARFKLCKDSPKHVHLYLADNSLYDDIPIDNKYDAGKAVDKAVANGYLRDSQRMEVIATLNPFRFPKGNVERSRFEAMRRRRVRLFGPEADERFCYNTKATCFGLDPDRY